MKTQWKLAIVVGVASASVAFVGCRTDRSHSSSTTEPGEMQSGSTTGGTYGTSGADTSGMSGGETVGPGGADMGPSGSPGTTGHHRAGSRGSMFGADDQSMAWDGGFSGESGDLYGTSDTGSSSADLRGTGGAGLTGHDAGVPDAGMPRMRKGSSGYR